MRHVLGSTGFRITETPAPNPPNISGVGSHYNLLTRSQLCPQAACLEHTQCGRTDFSTARQLSSSVASEISPVSLGSSSGKASHLHRGQQSAGSLIARGACRLHDSKENGVNRQFETICAATLPRPTITSELPRIRP